MAIAYYPSHLEPAGTPLQEHPCRICEGPVTESDSDGRHYASCRECFAKTHTTEAALDDLTAKAEAMLRYIRAHHPHAYSPRHFVSCDFGRQCTCGVEALSIAVRNANRWLE